MPNGNPESSAPIRTFEITSIVGVFDPSRVERAIVLGTEQIEAIENTLGASLQGGRAGTPRGNAAVLTIQGRQVDLLMQDDRVEVRSLGSSFTPDVAQLMADFLENVVGRIGSFPWRLLGYNFVLRIQLSGNATEKIAQQFFKDDLKTTLGHNVKGGAAWVWLEMDQETLFLKLEPHRDNPASNRVLANANFTRQIDPSGFPSSAQAAEDLWSNWLQVEAVLESLQL